MDCSKNFHPRFYSENTNDTNATWKTIRSCIPKKSVSTRVYSNDDKTVADRFNQFFTSIGKTTNKKIKLLANECSYAPVQPTYSPELSIAEQLFIVTEVHCSDVEIRIVLSLARNKAPRIELMPSKTLHLLSLPPLLLLLLLHLPLVLLPETGKMLNYHQF